MVARVGSASRRRVDARRQLLPGERVGELVGRAGSAKTVPKTATPNEAPMERKKVAPEVATPRSS